MPIRTLYNATNESRILCNGLIKENDSNLIFAHNGVGKTTFCYSIAEKLQQEGKKVCYLDFETTETDARKKGLENVSFDIFLSDTLQLLTENVQKLDLKKLLEDFVPNVLSFIDDKNEDIQLLRDAITPTNNECNFDIDVLNFVDDIRIKQYQKSEYKASEITKKYDTIIIDNLTFFCNDLLEANEMREIVKQLNKYAHKKNITIICVLHSRKRSIQNGDTCLTTDQINGSSNIANFFANIIGLAKVGGVTYMKQCKTRSEKRFDTESIAVLQLVQTPFFHFEITSTANEYTIINNAKKYDLIEEIKRLQSEGLTQQKIAKELGINQSTVSRCLDGMKKNDYGLTEIEPTLFFVKSIAENTNAEFLEYHEHNKVLNL